MIYLIVGRPRSGKSYEAVKYHVIPSLKEGRKVITNLPIDIDYVRKIHGPDVANLVEVVSFDYSDFDSNAVVFPFSRPEHYQDEWRNEKGQGPLYVIDEAHFSLPKGATDRAVKKFFTMHGHYGVDILLMTQHQRQIDSDILNLVEIVYRTIKNTALGSKNTYTKKVQDGNRGAIVNTEQRKYDKTIFPYYKSHTQSAGAVLEKEASDVKAIWRHWSLYGCLLCAAIVIYQISANDVKAPFVIDSPDSTIVNETQNTKLSESPSSELSSSQTSDTFVKSGVKSSKTLSELAIPTHPFHKVKLHITGSSTSGRVGHEVHDVYFSASRNGQAMFDLRLRDLILAGYDVNVLGDCLVMLSFRDYLDYLTCDSPSVGVGGVIEESTTG